MSEAILRAEGLEKWYSAGRAGRVGLRRPAQVEAVSGVDLEIRAGETLVLAAIQDSTGRRRLQAQKQAARSALA